MTQTRAIINWSYKISSEFMTNRQRLTLTYPNLLAHSGTYRQHFCCHYRQPFPWPVHTPSKPPYLGTCSSYFSVNADLSLHRVFLYSLPRHSLNLCSSMPNLFKFPFFIQISPLHSLDYRNPWATVESTRREEKIQYSKTSSD